MALRPDQQAIARVLEYGRSAYHAFPEKVGPVLALMQLYWEATITQSRRIRGMAANQILVGAIEGRVGFGPDDFAFIRRDAGRMAQFLIDAEPALRLAVTARNHSAATSIERSLGRKPWWHADATLDPAPVTNGRMSKRRRLYLGAELLVTWEGETRRARLTSFIGDTEVRLKIGPDAGPVPDAGFKLVSWDRETLAINTPGSNIVDSEAAARGGPIVCPACSGQSRVLCSCLPETYEDVAELVGDPACEACGGDGDVVCARCAGRGAVLGG